MWLFRIAQFLVLSSVGLAADVIPIALHQLVVVGPSGDAVIRLSGYDEVGNPVSRKIIPFNVL
jgi:hypothetical protein